MSIRNQIACLLAVLTVALVVTTYAVQSRVILPAFERLERDSALADVKRCSAAIEREIEMLSHFCLDWSAWDDVYRFAEDRNDDFIDSNLKEKAFEISHVNLICILNVQNQIVWGGLHDFEANEKLIDEELFAALTDQRCPLTQFQSLESNHSGIITTTYGPLLIAARPITTSLIEGPSRGTMIFGRLLNKTQVSKLRERTAIDLNVWHLFEDNLSSYIRELADQAADSVISRVVSEKQLEAFDLMWDIYQQPILLVHAKLPRPTMAQGRVATRFATGCTAVCGILTMFVLAIVLRWRITGPLQQMANHAIQLGSQSNFKARLNLSRQDEIGILAKEFDQMVQHLDDSRKQLSDSAHQAGMAEIASEILHNVGNAVNSLNCSASHLEQQLSQSKLSGLTRTAGLLNEQSHDLASFFSHDPRGPKLIGYIQELSRVLQRERDENLGEVGRLQETSRHIAEIIAAQQSYAKRSDFRQEVDLRQLVTEVLAINQELIRSMEVRVDIQIPELPELMLSKSRLTQVFVNLVRNSLQAMREKPSDQRALQITARVVDECDLEIEVTDSGVGFDQEVQAKLFTHGFTTKDSGNGIGLHYCANAIREIGGHIAAKSPGKGLGATFRVRLPNQINNLASC